MPELDPFAPPEPKENTSDEAKEASSAPDSPAPVAAVRPLPVGSFLNGELEIVQLLERGPVNIYRANAGGWGDNDWKWVWERASSAAEPMAGPGEQEGFLAPALRFVQDGREYAVYNWDDEREAFADRRAGVNDETFIAVVARLAHALGLLEAHGLRSRLGFDALYFEGQHLRGFGFFDAPSPGDAGALRELATLGGTFVRSHLAPRATLRLDDVWASLPFSVELKDWAHTLEAGGFASVAEARDALERFAPMPSASIAVQTDVGLEREHNEDGVLSLSLRRASRNVNASLDLLAVADGMGGHEAGEIASQTALDTLAASLLKRQSLDWNDNFVLWGAGRELIEEVNAAVVRGNENPPFAAMRQKPGTTLVFALRVGKRLLIGNVGDSRLYRWNERAGLELLTKDHSYVQDLLDAGKISPDEAWGHPDGSIITSHIGMPRGLLSDVSLRLISPGDRVFLVSDGVVDTLRDEQIEEIAASASDGASLCRSLVDAANEAGGIDNISVAVLWCE